MTVAHPAAIVTGAARGIGAAIAHRLAAEGHDVAILDLAAEACAETVAAVEACGRRALALSCDVSNEDAVTAALAQVEAELGPPLVLVNNAGLIRDRTVQRMSAAEWDQVLAVNLRSVFLLSRAVLPAMRTANYGRIVSLSSIAALGVAGEANYAAAKAGVQGFTRSLALETGRFGITVNSVAPGFVVTEMTRAVADRMRVPFEQLVDEALQQIVVGRPGEPDDIAHAVAYFVDARSSFVTGQTLYVAGAPRG
ncbi:SDR family oxidoreductase [Sphingomonas sp. KRR8]|uniref:SDR family oxidoreductase n=1 Tax=Sphingomonas sp. KRR8 TaxID=2942996 RepID=UPI00201FC6EC|nr:SDR family oxidoreductase [Sphingomonas sp. KRR8]URD59911.1 SDR family oxidoreductase [Sphingomonas sp. KRR8]